MCTCKSRTSCTDSPPPASNPKLQRGKGEPTVTKLTKLKMTSNLMHMNRFGPCVSLKLKVQEKLCPQLDPSILQHNRLVSYFPFRAKLLEKVAASKMQCFLINTNLFQAFQSGLLHCTAQRHLVSVSSRISSSQSGILLRLV